ncbi:hypothetical protein niasHT_012602 [Heterodera trifolii]|uniref:Uncharacterized protein n=1 Tax=Heterodera trifolii TaxID=157864 RepID=A0ABD2L1E2_9BILA
MKKRKQQHICYLWTEPKHDLDSVNGCVCPQADAICVRSEYYPKPIECLDKVHPHSFAQHLLSKPCDSATALVEKLSNSVDTGCHGLTILLVLVFSINV